MPDVTRRSFSSGSAPSNIIGTYHHDLASNLVFASEGLAGYFNTSCALARQGQALAVYLDALVAADRSVLEMAIWRAQCGEPLRATYRVASQRLGVRRVQDVGTCFLNPHGEPIAIAGYLVDVTEAEQEAVALPQLVSKLTTARDDAHALKLDLVTYVLELAILEIETRKR